MTLATASEAKHIARHYILAAVTLTVAAILGQTWWAVEQDRWLTLAAERNSALIAVRLLEEHAKLTLSGSDQSLGAFFSAIRAAPSGSAVSDAEIREILTKA